MDTNVPVVANGRSEQADDDCVLACVEALERVRDLKVVLDDQGHILQEYIQNLSMSGQPGVGDFFMKWVWSVQADLRMCEKVQLTPRDDQSEDYAEFPDNPDLDGFDRSDRKFVAAALASRLDPEILKAVDSDWAEPTHYTALRRAGLKIRFLCPQHVCPTEAR